MGLSISRIKFEKEIPSMEKIRNQFRKQTGLEIWMIVDLNLLTLPINNQEVVEKLYEDINKYNTFQKKEFNGEWLEMRKESRIINHISYFKFYNFLFYGIDFKIENNIIELESEIRSFYFSNSLDKTLIDLGGKYVDRNNEFPLEWKPPKRWKKLKHWDDYKWYNKPRK